jgi:hypothetical protein
MGAGTLRNLLLSVRAAQAMDLTCGYACSFEPVVESSGAFRSVHRELHRSIETYTIVSASITSRTGMEPPNDERTDAGTAMNPGAFLDFYVTQDQPSAVHLPRSIRLTCWFIFSETDLALRRDAVPWPSRTYGLTTE